MQECNYSFESTVIVTAFTKTLHLNPANYCIAIGSGNEVLLLLKEELTIDVCYTGWVFFKVAGPG